MLCITFFILIFHFAKIIRISDTCNFFYKTLLDNLQLLFYQIIA